MDSWGSESLDLENYTAPVEKYKHEGVYIPMSVLDKIVNRNRIQTIQVTRMEYISKLMVSIAAVGVKNPGTITLGKNGVTLSDGNHRFVACKLLNLDKFPIQFEQGGIIKIGGTSYETIITLLLQGE